MAQTPRMTVSLTKEEQEKLSKLVERCDLRSAGQLLRFLISGNPQKIDLIATEAKKIHNLF